MFFSVGTPPRKMTPAEGMLGSCVPPAGHTRVLSPACEWACMVTSTRVLGCQATQVTGGCYLAGIRVTAGQWLPCRGAPAQLHSRQLSLSPCTHP